MSLTLKVSRPDQSRPFRITRFYFVSSVGFLTGHRQRHNESRCIKATNRRLLHGNRWITRAREKGDTRTTNIDEGKTMQRQRTIGRTHTNVCLSFTFMTTFFNEKCCPKRKSKEPKNMPDKSGSSKALSVYDLDGLRLRRLIVILDLIILDKTSRRIRPRLWR